MHFFNGSDNVFDTRLTRLPRGDAVADLSYTRVRAWHHSYDQHRWSDSQRYSDKQQSAHLSQAKAGVKYCCGIRQKKKKPCLTLHLLGKCNHGYGEKTKEKAVNVEGVDEVDEVLEHLAVTLDIMAMFFEDMSGTDLFLVFFIFPLLACFKLWFWCTIINHFCKLNLSSLAQVHFIFIGTLCLTFFGLLMSGWFNFGFLIITCMPLLFLYFLFYWTLTLSKKKPKEQEA